MKRGENLQVDGEGRFCLRLDSLKAEPTRTWVWFLWGTIAGIRSEGRGK